MDFFSMNKNAGVVPEQPAEERVEEKVVPMQKHFAVWDAGGESFQLKLQTSGVKELEARYKAPIMDLMQNEHGIPPLTVMLDVVHVAMKPWTHKVTHKDMEALYDRYAENGGDLMNFYTNVYLEVFMVSGFLSQRMASEMKTSLEEMRKEL